MLDSEMIRFTKSRAQGRWRRLSAWLVGGLILLYAAVCLLAWFVQDPVVFPLSVEEPLDRGVPPGADLIWVETEAGERVESWFFPGLGRSAQSPGAALIFFHGNAQLLDHALEYAELYPTWGISVLLVEYRGYGRSGGRPSQTAIGRDMDAFHAALIARPEVDPARLIYHGRSLGCGVAADLTRRQPAQALILESSFTSLRAMFRRYGLPGFLARHPFDVLDVVERFDGPILLLHGTQDDIVPVAQARRLAAVAHHAELIEFEALHDLPPDWPAHVGAIRDFLEREAGIVSPSAE